MLSTNKKGGELNWRLLLLGAAICAVSAAATPYVTLKLGMSVDLTLAGMFITAALLGRRAKSEKHLAIQLNIVQTMIGAVSGVGFMVVVMAAFFYIQNVFGRDIGFHPTWWQMFLWLVVSANLGVFMGTIPRRFVLNDTSLSWPTGRATLSVAETLSDKNATENTRKRRGVLFTSTGLAGFFVFLRDGLGVITPIVGNKAINMTLGLEFLGIGVGMLVPLSVGLSGVLGVWLINSFGENVARLVALTGTAPENWAQCQALISQDKAAVTDFIKQNCGQAAEFLQSPSHFKHIIQWMMWPATAMMIFAALTSIIVPVVKNIVERHKGGLQSAPPESLADEKVPMKTMLAGIGVCTALIVWMASAWFSMPWKQTLLAVAIQPILIIAGLRVLAITGQGPVSLMTNFTQFVFGLIWPAHIQQNLNGAYVAANSQASSESTGLAYWVARRLGGSFRTLITAQLIVLPIGALLVPLMFNVMERTYGIGPGENQLSAPTGLKIASLAIVMEKGLSALPRGAFTASIVAAVLGVVFELLLAINKRDRDGKLVTDSEGNSVQRFWWVPIPSALGFALILPPSLTLATAVGSIISAAWKKFSTAKEGTYEMFNRVLAAGLLTGEAIVGGVLLPASIAFVAYIKTLF